MINLNKGQGIDLNKHDTLDKITLGLKWGSYIVHSEESSIDNSKKKGLFSRLFGKKKEESFTASRSQYKDVDLDATVLGFSKGKKVAECSFKSLCSFAVSAGDDRTGRDSKTSIDNEQIQIDFSKIPSYVDSIYLIMNIFNYSSGIRLKDLSKSICRVYDKNLNQIATFELKEYGNDTGVLIGEIKRNPISKKFEEFKAIGESFNVTGIDDFSEKLESM